MPVFYPSGGDEVRRVRVFRDHDLLFASHLWKKDVASPSFSLSDRFGLLLSGELSEEEEGRVVQVLIKVDRLDRNTVETFIERWKLYRVAETAVSSMVQEAADAGRFEGDPDLDLFDKCTLEVLVAGLCNKNLEEICQPTQLQPA